MGTWDRKNFGNDDAADFVWAVKDNGVSELETALKKVAEFPQDDYLEAPECTTALSAAEVVAYMRGKPSEDFPEELKDVTPQNVEELSKLALQAIERITSNSELRELWEESPEYNDWLQVQEDLRRRLQ